jgi:cytoskeletal protein RodZ
MAEDTGYEGAAAETVGERLRAARAAQGISLEEIAARTRIPTRHLESLETSEWSKLPAATYSIGFAKSYASAVGLDRTEVGEALRAEMAGQPARTTMSAEVFEPVDPARVMPKWLVILAVLAVLAVIAALLFMRQRDLDGDDSAAPVAAEAPASTAQPVASAAPAASASGPVVITANEPTWIQVSERGGGAALFQGELAAGQSYQVPATAIAPVLRTGRPESIRIAVGTADAPAVGPGATTVRDVSLLAADLMRGGPATTPAATPVQRP